MTGEPVDEPSAVASPCVRLCTLDQHDVCVGCLRTVSEIMRWSAASDAEKRAILARCRERAARRPPGSVP